MSIDTTERNVHLASSGVNETDDSRNVGSLLSQLAQDVGGLVSTEVNLAKAEISESVDDAKKGVISLAMAAVVLFAGVLVLLNGVARTLSAFTDMQAWASFLIVGGIVSIIGAIMLANGKSKLSADNLALNRTSQSLRKDQQVAKEQMQ